MNLRQIMEAEVKTLKELVASIEARQASAEDFYMELVTFLQKSFEGQAKNADAHSARLAEKLDLLVGAAGGISSTRRIFEDALKSLASNRPARRRRLFISTGFYATAIAATLASQDQYLYENYLLITIDRQDAQANIRWAHQMNDSWQAALTIGHVEFYEVNANLSNPFHADFDDVYSAHFLTHSLLRRVFPATRYFFYEEGFNELCGSCGCARSRIQYSLLRLVTKARKSGFVVECTD